MVLPSNRLALQTKLGRRTFMSLAGATLLNACTPPRLPLRVGTIVFPGYELLFLARAMGWLKPDFVRLIELQSSSDSVRSLAAGKLEAAQLTMDELMAARAGGLDLRAILVLDTSNGADQVLARPNISMANLVGRKIAAEDNSVGALMMASLLEASGVHIDQVIKVPITQSRATEFYQKGLADVVVTAEPWASQIRALGGHTIFDSSAVPDRILDVIAVRADVLDAHTDALQHVVTMQFAALELFRKQPEKASMLMAPRLQIAPTEVAASFAGLKLPDILLNQSMLQKNGVLAKNLPVLQSILLSAGLLRRPIDTTSMLDDRFVRRKAST